MRRRDGHSFTKHKTSRKNIDYTNNELLYEWCSHIEDPLGWNTLNSGGTGENWGELGRTGENWGELGRTGENWGELGRTGENWGELLVSTIWCKIIMYTL